MSWKKKFYTDYLSAEAIAKVQTDYRDYQVKSANPFLILRRPGDYA
ncbi:hypothetical protein [Nostoc sp.]